MTDEEFHQLLTNSAAAITKQLDSMLPLGTVKYWEQSISIDKAGIKSLLLENENWNSVYYNLSGTASGSSTVGGQIEVSGALNSVHGIKKPQKINYVTSCDMCICIDETNNYIDNIPEDALRVRINEICPVHKHFLLLLDPDKQTYLVKGQVVISKGWGEFSLILFKQLEFRKYFEECLARCSYRKKTRLELVLEQINDK